MQNLSIIILAAGQGKRMKTDLSKVLVKTCANKPLIQHVLETALSLEPQEIIIVVGHQAEQVKQFCSALKLSKSISIKFALQAERLGTGHAVQVALPELSASTKQILILSGDVPLVKASTLQQLAAAKDQDACSISLISMQAPMGSAYGRVVRSTTGAVTAIVERKDCTSQQLQIQECNASIYFADRDFVCSAIPKLKNKNSQSEYYLTDLIGIAAEENLKIASLLVENPAEVQGVNTYQDLVLVNRELAQHKIIDLIHQGVVFQDPSSCLVEPTVSFSGAATIGPNVQLMGSTEIGEDVSIHGNAILSNTKVATAAIIKNYVVAEDAEISANAQIGPFANLRAGSKIGAEAKVGNFVETKNAELAAGVKASHLSYLGDCIIGKETNIGAGTIFANYDGKNKHQTTVGENCFIGSNSTLVAPIKIEEKVTIGAGSVIRTSISKNCLALTKGAFKIIENWSKIKR